MSKQIHVALSSLLIVITITLSIAFFYCTFAFPLILAGWKEQGRVLVGNEVLLANLSKFFMSYGVVIMPLFFLSFIGSIVWLIVALLKKTSRSDNAV